MKEKTDSENLIEENKNLRKALRLVLDHNHYDLTQYVYSEIMKVLKGKLAQEN